MDFSCNNQRKIVSSLYREGSGNVICLDILRTLKKTPECLHAYLSFMNETNGTNQYLDRTLKRIETNLSTSTVSIDMLECHARTLATQMALCLQASLLIRRFPSVVADAFCLSRLGPDRGSIFGDLPAGIDIDALVQRLPC
jgi:putative acyl-CoA dehydrogenase